MLKLTVEATGFNRDDLVDALKEVIRLVKDGYHSGVDGSFTEGARNYSFDITGEETNEKED